MANVLELKEQRAKLIEGAKLIIDSAEGRDLTEEEQASFDGMMSQADDLEGQAETAERKMRLESAQQGLKVSTRKTIPAQVKTPAGKEDRALLGDVVKAWASWGNPKGYQATPDVFRAADRMGVTLGSNTMTIKLDQRAQTKGTTTAGGYTVPQDFADKICEHLLYFCPIRDYCTVLGTSDGRAIPYPNNDDSGNVAAITSENSALSETDTVFGQKTLGAYNYKTMVRLSLELMQDSAFNLEDYLARQIGIRVGRAQEADFVTGNGSSKPTGIVYSATNAVSNWTTTYANLVSLFYSVDKAYRMNGKFFMSDTVLAAIRGLTDDALRPLINITNGFEDGDMETLFGKEIVVSNSMDSSGSAKKVIAFGDPTDFVIRDVGEVQLVKSEHRYFEYGLVAFIAYLRSDSNWFGPTRALKCGTTAA